jgi:protein-S-isoprenylcysteine O-methyltransferase Ste14
MAKSLKSRLITQIAVSLGLSAAMLFLPAGTLRFWEAWAFMAVVFIPMVIFSVYFYKHDPRMVERRMQTKEKVKEQKLVMKVASLIFFVGFLIPGLDHRFGWTRGLTGPVPLWFKITALALVLIGYLMTMWVVDENRFAARTIQVEPGQNVIASGPYRWMRHPMYFGGLVMLLPVPVSLGSFVGLPFFALLIPVIVVRLLNEERVLREELPGYVEYCEKTRYRLVPYVW